MSLGENDYLDQTEIDPTERSQGGNDYQEIQPLIDQTEIDPTEISQRDNIDNQEVERLGEKLSDGAQKTEFFFSSPCIYRVPKELRKLKESAYTPRLIAIGPLHQNDPHLQTPMQHVKTCYANHLLCRLTEGMEDLEAKQKKFTVLRQCMAAMEKSIEDAKKCYPEEVTLDVEMMLVDGCFILEVLYRFYLEREGYPGLRMIPDPILGNPVTHNIVQYDLLLLENQIPFLVLERLFPLTLAQIPNLPEKNLLLTDYVYLPLIRTMYSQELPQGNSINSDGAKTSFFCSPRDCVLWVLGDKMGDSKPKEEVSSEEEVPSRNANNYHHIGYRKKKYRHMLHKLHDDFLPHDRTGMKFISNFVPSASELAYAGVEFVSSTENDLFNVKFTEPEGPFWWCHSARFQIPFLNIFDFAEPYLRNLVAFEQCCPGIAPLFTSYVVLMDMLVNFDIDVQELEKAGVVRNWLGATEDATNLFNNLFKEVSIGPFFFNDTCNRASRYSKRFWPKNMAYVRRKYFASPWTFTAFCLAFIVFGVTIAEFILSIHK